MYNNARHRVLIIVKLQIYNVVMKKAPASVVSSQFWEILENSIEQGHALSTYRNLLLLYNEYHQTNFF